MQLRSILSSLPIVALLALFSCNPGAKREGKAEQTIKDFYNKYIIESERFPYDEKKVNLILQKYCTPELMEQMNSPELDFDPFVNAQDHDVECLKSLKVIHDKKREELYHLTFTSQGRPVNVTLELIEVEEQFKISSVY